LEIKDVYGNWIYLIVLQRVGQAEEKKASLYGFYILLGWQKLSETKLFHKTLEHNYIFKGGL
jgi:hypothetical protein